MIQLVPIIANIPAFQLHCRALSEEIPTLTDGIDRLCNEIEGLLTERPPARYPRTLRLRNTDPHLAELISRASAFLGFDAKAARSSNPLDILVNSAEATVSDLQNQLRVSIEAKEEAERESATQAMVTRFRQIRQATDDIAKRYQTEKDAFIESILTKLKLLLSGECGDSAEDPPIRRFNAIYSHLLRDIAALRTRVAESIDESDHRSDPILQTVSSENTLF
jgi:hypothetical protein